MLFHANIASEKLKKNSDYEAAAEKGLFTMESYICGDCEIVTEDLNLHSKLYHNGIIEKQSIIFKSNIFLVEKKRKKNVKRKLSVVEDELNRIKWESV